MKKILILLIGFALCFLAPLASAGKDVEIRGKQLISQTPPFTLTLPSELRLINSSSSEHPEENSLTRSYILIRDRSKRVEEIFILQIADRVNSQAGPITAPPLRPYKEQRTYFQGKYNKGQIGADYLIQLMAWNPAAPSLEPVIKEGMVIPPHWALQGQLLFVYEGEHAVLIKYSRDANSFGTKVSEEGDKWEKGSISGNEKKVCETFQETFTKMINTITIKNP